MTKGQIKTLNVAHEYGFITAADGLDYFFHRAALEGASFDSLDVGMAVSFTATEGHGRGPRAEQVRVLGDGD